MAMRKKYTTPDFKLLELLSESVCDDEIDGDVLDISDLDNSTDDKTPGNDGEDAWED
jgi:hypothetical protein